MISLLHSRNGTEESIRERTEPWSPTNLDQLLEVVNKQKAPVLYYSLAAGRLYAWLLQPHKGNQFSLISQELYFSY